MKLKKGLAILCAAVITVTSLPATVFADEGTGTTQECVEHVLTKVEAKEATCTEEGLEEAYWICEVCEKMFSDEEGTTEITEPKKIGAKGHSLTKVEAKEATCTEEGLEEAYWICEVCEKMFSDEEGTTEITEPKKIGAKGHSLTKVEAKEATCTDDGYEAYWTCEVCGKLFSDENGENEITEPEEIPATGHTLTETEQKDATCTEAGYKAYWTCEVCKKLFIDAEGKNEIEKPIEIPALGHTLKKVAKKAATCKEAGYEAYWTCSKCGKLFSDAKGTKQINKPITIAKTTAHKWVSAKKAAKKPTAKKAGKLKQTCSVCKKTRKINIPKTSLTISAKKGTTETIAIAANSGWKVKLKKSSQKKFITVNAKTGKITVKVKPANYKNIPKSIPVVLTNGKYKYTINVKLEIPAPKVSFKRVPVVVKGAVYYRYFASYDISNADSIQVRVKEYNYTDLNNTLDQYLRTPKSNSESYFRIKKSLVDSWGGKITVTVVAKYGKNQSKPLTLKVSK